MKLIISTRSTFISLKSLFFLTVTVFSNSMQQASAQTPVNITTTAAPFLRISPDARAGGMGDLGLATPVNDDANSVFYNRAKLPFAEKATGLGVTYTPWLQDVTQGMYLMTASAYHKLNDNQVISGSIRYFNMGDIPMADYSGQKLPTAQPRELAADLGYSMKLSPHLGLAVAARYINSKLATGNIDGTTYRAASSVAADVSLYYDGVDSTKGGWSAGLALSNLGGKLSYTNDATQKEFLPANAGIGIAYTMVPNEDNRFTIGVDLNHLLVPKAPVDSAGLAGYYNKGIAGSWFSSFDNKQTLYSIGAEYTYHRQFSIRAGYLIVPNAAGGNGGFTAGLGLRFSTLDLNFSYLAGGGNRVTRNPLSNTVRFGLNFGLGK